MDIYAKAKTNACSCYSIHDTSRPVLGMARALSLTRIVACFGGHNCAALYLSSKTESGMSAIFLTSLPAKTLPCIKKATNVHVLKAAEALAILTSKVVQ